MDEMQWRQIHAETFAEEDREYVAIYTTTVEAQSELSKALLLDPLPLLVENLPEVTPDWTVSVERVNAQIPLLGPKRLIWIVTLFLTLQRVHAVGLRVAET